MAIYWIYFDLPKRQGEMRLEVDAETDEIATSLATKKAHKMSTEWKHRETICAR